MYINVFIYTHMYVYIYIESYVYVHVAHVCEQADCDLEIHES